MSRDESLDSFMKKKESDLQLQRKRQNCVVVVVAAGVWCVRMVARGGSTYTLAHAEELRFVEDPSEVYSMAYVMK
jgi:hypothetical protein